METARPGPGRKAAPGMDALRRRSATAPCRHIYLLPVYFLGQSPRFSRYSELISLSRLIFLLSFDEAFLPLIFLLSFSKDLRFTTTLLGLPLL